MTFEAEYVDAEYLDTEYAKYVNAAGKTGAKRLDWPFWVAMAALALVVYTAAFLFQARGSETTVAPKLDFHNCTFPDVQVDLARANGAEHDTIAPYAHSVCSEGDVRLWESTH